VSDMVVVKVNEEVDVAESLVEIWCEDLRPWLSASVVATMEKGPLIRWVRIAGVGLDECPKEVIARGGRFCTVAATEAR
jgi:hypothetical protein